MHCYDRHLSFCKKITLIWPANAIYSVNKRYQNISRMANYLCPVSLCWTKGVTICPIKKAVLHSLTPWLVYLAYLSVAAWFGSKQQTIIYCIVLALLLVILLFLSRCFSMSKSSTRIETLLLLFLRPLKSTSAKVSSERKNMWSLYQFFLVLEYYNVI